MDNWTQDKETQVCIPNSRHSLPQSSDKSRADLGLDHVVGVVGLIAGHAVSVAAAEAAAAAVVHHEALDHLDCLPHAVIVRPVPTTAIVRPNTHDKKQASYEAGHARGQDPRGERPETRDKIG